MATKKKLDLTDVDARTTPVGLFNFAETYWLSAKALKAAEVKGVPPLLPTPVSHLDRCRDRDPTPQSSRAGHVCRGRK